MSSTRQMPAMDPARRMLIARARDRDQIRNRVISESQGVLTEAEIEERVEQILFERRSAGGKAGAARVNARNQIAREIVAALPEMLAIAETNVAVLRRLATLAEDVA